MGKQFSNVVLHIADFCFMKEIFKVNQHIVRLSDFEDINYLPIRFLYIRIIGGSVAMISLQ